MIEALIILGGDFVRSGDCSILPEHSWLGFSRSDPGTLEYFRADLGRGLEHAWPCLQEFTEPQEILRQNRFGFSLIKCFQFARQPEL